MKTVILTILILFFCVPCFGQSSLDFDGTNDELTIANESTFDLEEALSVAFWFNVHSISTNFETMASKRQGVGNDDATFLTNIQNTFGLQWGWAHNATFELSVIPIGGNISANTWYFFMGTINQNGANTETEAFLDCVSKDSDTHTSTDLTDGLNNVAATFGVIPDENNEDFDGQGAYYHIYNRVITTEECLEIRRNPCSITSGLLTCIPMWGRLTEPDLSGNGNTASSAGATGDADGPPVFFGGGGR